MAGIGWSEDLAIGVAAIDGAHRELVEVLAEANSAFDSGDVRAALRQLRRFLTAFANHFAVEQRILGDRDAELAAARAREWHTTQFVFAAHPLEADDVEVLGQLLHCANAWLVDHILCQDAPSRALLGAAPGGRGGRFRPGFDMLKLRWRIALLALVPLLALAGLVAVSAWELERNASSMRLMSRMNHLNGNVADLIHELQRERGLATLVFYDRRLGRDQLQQQYLDTDTALADFRAVAAQVQHDLPGDDAAAQRLEEAMRALDLIPEVRGDVDTDSFDAVENMDFYTTAIEDLSAVVPEVIRTFLPSDFAKLTFSQIFLQQLKERAGHERAAGVAILSSAAPGRPITSVRDLAAEQRALGAGFAVLAPADLAALYDAVERATEGPMTWMRMALENGELTHLGAQEWFELTSRRIDSLHQVEDQVTARLHEEAAKLDDATNHRFLALGGGMVVLMLVSLAMVLGLGWSILPPLARLAEAVRRLADGERAVTIPGLSARDELGGVARFVQRLKERLVHGDLLDARRLTANAERLRVVADSTPGIVFRVFQSDGGRLVVVCASRKLRDIVGLAPADVVDMPVRRLLRRLVRPEDRGGLLRLLRRSEPSSLSFEFQLRSDTGPRPGANAGPGASGPRWLRVVVSPSPTEGGWLWDGVALDISGLKAAERERGRIAAEAGRLGGTAGGAGATLAAGMGSLVARLERAVAEGGTDQAELLTALAEARRLKAQAVGLEPSAPQRAAANVILFKKG